jgi:hypothetical protein
MINFYNKVMAATGTGGAQQAQQPPVHLEVHQQNREREAFASAPKKQRKRSIFAGPSPTATTVHNVPHTLSQN